MSLWGTNGRPLDLCYVGEKKNLNLDKLPQSGFCDIGQLHPTWSPTSLNLY